MIGVYVHIPFCLKKCNYCDFYSISDLKLQEKYFEVLEKEINSFPDYKADTIFFGGGTPSLVNPIYIAKITKLLKNKFSMPENGEITIELNPKTFTTESLMIYKECGINRLSIGLQSACESQLSRLGRVHNLKEFEKSYILARNMGFSNINIDIMYALPYETESELKYTLGALKEFNPEHISAYALTLSENTPIYKMNFSYPSEDEIFRSYMMICESLSDYRHYEISNFGKRICKHNFKYWNREEYVGFGASASGFTSGVRYTNKSDIKKYISDFSAKEEYEKLTESDELFETVMLSLRTDEGLDTELLKEKFNFNIYEKNEKFLKKLLEQNLITLTDKGFRLSDEGFFVSNEIISSLKTEV